MRIYINLTENKETIPFNYQSFLTGVLHKWIGKDNVEHDNLSLYSFSGLKKTETTTDGKGINLTKDSYYFISAHNKLLINKIVDGIYEDKDFCFGARVSHINIRETPNFPNKQTFTIASPVFMRKYEDERIKHIRFDDDNISDYLTDTMRRKLLLAGLSADNVKVYFDESYKYPKTKLITYKGVNNRVNVCPVIVEGSPEQVAFAWNVGVGHCTGIGFGALY